MKYHKVIWNIMKYRSHCSKQRLTALNQSVNPINQSINWSADSQHSSTQSLIAPGNCCLNAPLLPLWDSTLLQRHSSQFYSNSSFPTLFSAGSCADAWPVWANNSGAALPPHCRSSHTAVLFFLRWTFPLLFLPWISCSSQRADAAVTAAHKRRVMWDYAASGTADNASSWAVRVPGLFASLSFSARCSLLSLQPVTLLRAGVCSELHKPNVKWNRGN